MKKEEKKKYAVKTIKPADWRDSGKYFVYELEQDDSAEQVGLSDAFYYRHVNDQVVNRMK